MKYFNKILALLVVSTAFQNVNAMWGNIFPSYKREEISMYDIKEINVLRNEGKVNIVAKNESLPGAVEKIFKINIPPRMDKQNVELVIKTFGVDASHDDDDIYDTWLSFLSMVNNRRVEELNICQQHVVDWYNVGVGLKNIDVQNVGIVGVGVFAYNKDLSFVRIEAHKAGVIIDKFAFAHCGTIDFMAICGDLKYVADKAFFKTYVHGLIILGKKNQGVFDSLIYNGISPEAICWCPTDE